MIGKIARMVIGRRLARGRGMSGAGGAIAGLLAPLVIEAVAKAIGKGRRNRADRKRMKHPKYPPRY